MVRMTVEGMADQRTMPLAVLRIAYRGSEVADHVLRAESLRTAWPARHRDFRESLIADAHVDISAPEGIIAPAVRSPRAPAAAPSVAPGRAPIAAPAPATPTGVLGDADTGVGAAPGRGEAIIAGLP